MRVCVWVFTSREKTGQLLQTFAWPYYKPQNKNKEAIKTFMMLVLFKKKTKNSGSLTLSCFTLALLQKNLFSKNLSLFWNFMFDPYPVFCISKPVLVLNTLVHNGCKPLLPSICRRRNDSLFMMCALFGHNLLKT